VGTALSDQLPTLSTIDRTPLDLDGISAFHCTGWTLDDDTGRVELRYSLDDRWHFTEVVELGRPAPESEGERAALHGALHLLWLVTGVSYYKVAAPPQVTVPRRLGPAERALLAAVYGPGLAEFRWTNGIDQAAVPEIVGSGSGPAAPGPGALGADGPVLVPVGGGKDSIVSIDLLTGAGHDAMLFAVNDHAAIEATIATARLPAVRVRRRLDPLLFSLNEQGARNGHVPVTAIVSMLAVAAAVQHGCPAVAMSNERSASDPTVEVDGVSVNHQFSKSLAFERVVAAAIASTVAPSLEYFSLLRPWSELAIMGRFAELSRFHPVFTSCNRAFAVLDGNRSPSWCGDCDKCRFVFLALAPFIERATLVAVVGRDLLADPAQLDGFRQLVGLVGVKPFECVGEVDECRWAVARLAASAEWADAPVVTALADELRRPGVALPQVDDAAVLGPSADHRVPERFMAAAMALDPAVTPTAGSPAHRTPPGWSPGHRG
jgi:hypothetical protein